MKRYLGTGSAHTGTSGFVNFVGGGADRVNQALEQVFSDHQDVVVLDGNSDWYAPRSTRPETFIVEGDRVALFHTGISGISSTGAVIPTSRVGRVLGCLFEACERKEVRGQHSNWTVLQTAKERRARAMKVLKVYSCEGGKILKESLGEYMARTGRSLKGARERDGEGPHQRTWRG